MPHGESSSPAPLPRLPQLPRKVPSVANLRTLWLRPSVTNRVWLASMAMREAPLGSLSPLCTVFQQDTKLPSLSKTDTRFNHSSVTYTCPCASTTRPAGQINWPGALPYRLNSPTYSSSPVWLPRETLLIRWPIPVRSHGTLLMLSLPRLATYTTPSASRARATGLLNPMPVWAPRPTL